MQLCLLNSSSLLRHHAAVHWKDVTCYECRSSACKEQHWSGDIARLSKSCEGANASNFATSSGLLVGPSLIAVRTQLGAMAFTRMRYGAHSTAHDRVMLTTAPLAA